MSTRILPSTVSEFKRVESPWATEELLAKPASEWLPDLLVYQPNESRRSLKHSRIEMLRTVSEAAQRNTAWGLDLADAMAARSEWKSDLWYWVISAWEKAELDQESKGRVLSCLSTSQLYPENSGDIADVLKKFLQGDDPKDLAELLDKIHAIATTLYPYAAAVEDISYNIRISEVSPDTSWFTKAINHPFGKLARFWVHSIDFWRKQQAVSPQALSTEYRRALDTIMEDNGIPGKLGRTILTSGFYFLHNVDSGWTEHHLLPLLDAQHEDFSCAWDGLIRRQPSPPTAELLKDQLIGGLQRAIQDFPENRLERFIQFYTLVMSYLVDNDKDKWICTFFEQAREKPELKHMFTTQIGHLLSDLDESSQSEWWKVWLKNYWNNRLQGVPCPLDDAEIATMFQWVIRLQGVFPEAVDMAVQMRPVPLKHSLDLSLRPEVSEMLINRYPTQLARFLIHLWKRNTYPWFWHSDSQILMGSTSAMGCLTQLQKRNAATTANPMQSGQCVGPIPIILLPRLDGAGPLEPIHSAVLL